MKTIPINILDREYQMRGDLNAMVFVEQSLGFPITKISEETFSAKMVLVVIYAGLMWKKNDCPKMEEIGEWIDNEERFVYCSQKTGELIQSVFGKKEEKVPNVLEESKNTGST